MELIVLIHNLRILPGNYFRLRDPQHLLFVTNIDSFSDKTESIILHGCHNIIYVLIR